MVLQAQPVTECIAVRPAAGSGPAQHFDKNEGKLPELETGAAEHAAALKTTHPPSPNFRPPQTADRLRQGARATTRKDSSSLLRKVGGRRTSPPDAPHPSQETALRVRDGSPHGIAAEARPALARDLRDYEQRARPAPRWRGRLTHAAMARTRRPTPRWCGRAPTQGRHDTAPRWRGRPARAVMARAAHAETARVWPYPEATRHRAEMAQGPCPAPRWRGRPAPRRRGRRRIRKRQRSSRAWPASHSGGRRKPSLPRGPTLATGRRATDRVVSETLHSIESSHKEARAIRGVTGAACN